MQIDLFTFIAQIVNFLILVALLYFFLFKKILVAIDKREKTIREEFETAKTTKEEAESKKNAYERELKEFAEEKEQLRKEAKLQVNEEKAKLLTEAKTALAEKKQAWENKLAQEKGDFFTRLEKKIAEEVYATSETVVAQLAGAELDRMLFQSFLKKVQELPKEQTDTLRTLYFKTKEERMTILSSFDPLEKEQEEIKQALSQILGETPRIDFRKERDHTLGISLKLGGFQLHWTSKHYFETLEEKFEKTFLNNNHG